MSIKVMSAVWELDLPPHLKFTALALADWADDSGGSIFPSKATVAAKTGVEPKTIQRHLRALQKLGLLVLVQKSDRAPQHYRIDLSADLGGGGQIDPPGETPMTQGGDTGDPGGGLPMTPGGIASDPQSVNYPSVEPSMNLLAVAPQTRQPDLLFEALCEVASIDWHEITEVGRGAVNRALKDLRKVGATPEQIKIRAVNYALRFESQPTPMALAKHWAQCATAPPRLDRRTVASRLDRFKLSRYLETWTHSV